MAKYLLPLLAGVAGAVIGGVAGYTLRGKHEQER